MPPLVSHRNRVVHVDETQLIENALEETFISADVASGSSTITVANIDGFAISQYLWINPFSERSEIVIVHASTAPSGSTITLTANTSFAHFTGEKVYRIEFNQVEISTAATISGSKTVLVTQALQAEQRETLYLDTSVSTGYYFARFKASVAGTFGSYSDPVIYDGFASNTLGYMVERALSDLELTLSEKISWKDCFEWVNSGLRLIQGKLMRWPEHYSYNTSIGTTARGVNTITMPTDVYDSETNKSILGLRIGTGKNLFYLDPRTFDAQLEGVASTVVTSQAAVGATTLNITNSYDFADSGTVDVYVSGTKYSITYTAVTRSTTVGALTGVPASGTGSVTVIIPAATPVWQGETEGTPQEFTVRNGAIEFWPLCDTAHKNMNVWADYSKVATSVNTQTDTIDFQRFDMLQDYLTFRMDAKANNNGKLDFKNGFYAQFKERMNDAIRTLPPNNLFKMSPKINTMSRRGSTSNPSLQDLNLSDQ